MLTNEDIIDILDDLPDADPTDTDEYRCYQRAQTLMQATKYNLTLNEAIALVLAANVGKLRLTATTVVYE